jgi:phage-related protein
VGHQIDQVQNGRDPDDWKPMGTVGAGVREIRVHEGKDQYRALYVTKLGDKVYVLHCFHKTTKQTSQSDIDVAAKRYRELVKELKK